VSSLPSLHVTARFSIVHPFVQSTSLQVPLVSQHHFAFPLEFHTHKHSLNPLLAPQSTGAMPIPPLPRVPPKRTHDSTSDYVLTRDSVEAFLLAFGDNDYPLPETVRVLDEIITDYIIETCHEAASVAHHARRAKIKLDDFKFMLRRDTGKLGRVTDMIETDKELKRKRKAFDTDEGAVLVEKDEGTNKMSRPRKKEKVAVEESVDGEGETKKKRKKKRDGGGDDASTVRSG
jgi:transcription initiation factor TFIID subunit 13